MARVDVDVVYASLCHKFARTLDIAISTHDKPAAAVLGLVKAAHREIEEVIGNDEITRPQQYNCAIIVSLMRLWPAYISQARGALEEGMARLEIALTLANLPPADKVVVRAILHQFSTNDVAPISDGVATKANRDLLLAAQHLRSFACHISNQ